MNFVYLLECSDKTLYCGWTNNIKKRVEAHNSGLGSRYTRARLPVKLIYFEDFQFKSDALKREIEIKRMSKKEKLELIKSSENFLQL